MSFILLALVACGRAGDVEDFEYGTHKPVLIEIEDNVYAEVTSEPVVIIPPPPPPPWQVGYIEDFDTLPSTSYEIIIPFGRYDWVSISGGFIIAVKTEWDGIPPDEYGELAPHSISYYSALLNFCGEYVVPFGIFDRIIQVGNNVVVVRDNQGNTNAYDFEGNPIFPAENNQVINMRGNATITRTHEGTGVVDLDGNIIIPFGIYDNIWFDGEPGNRLFLTEIRTDDRTQRRGVRDLEGNVIIAPGQFESIGSIYGAYGRIVVGRPSSSGFMGEAIFNIETGELVHFPTQGLVAWDGLRIIAPGYVMTGHGIFTFDSERISPENLSFRSHPRCTELGLFTVSQGNRTGIYDLNLNEVFWLGSRIRVWQLAYPLALVSTEESIFNNAVLDFYGQMIIPFGTYRRIVSILGENRFLIDTGIDAIDGQYLAVVNASGQEIIPAGIYGNLTPIRGTNLLWTEYCEYYNEATGLIDTNGRVIFPPREYTFRQHWALRDPCNNFADTHFFMINDSNNRMAFVRLVWDE
jgi:hypothetical protein